jgi:hypothetical protein
VDLADCQTLQYYALILPLSALVALARVFSFKIVSFKLGNFLKMAPLAPLLVGEQGGSPP